MSHQPFPSYDFRVWDAVSTLAPDVGDVYAAADGNGPVTAIGLVRGRQDRAGSWLCTYSYGPGYGHGPGNQLADYANAVVSRFMEVLVDDAWDDAARRAFLGRLDALTARSPGRPVPLLVDGVEAPALRWEVPGHEGWIVAAASAGGGGMAVAGHRCAGPPGLVPADPGIWGRAAEGTAMRLALPS